jgi:hypothetical protein
MESMSKNNTSRFALTATLITGLVSLPAIAADQLNAAQLKEMFSDKTVSGVSADNKPMTTYFSADGKLIQKSASGEKKQGSWRVDNKGQQCITWSGSAEVCSTVVARGDGTYQRMVGDKATVTIQKMRQGNLLDE